MKFQHTAARRRLHLLCRNVIRFRFVSTHSRAKAAATYDKNGVVYIASFNTQPREGGCPLRIATQLNHRPVSTHSRAKAAAVCHLKSWCKKSSFQHTAARRRLHIHNSPLTRLKNVSTHSRAKAAALPLFASDVVMVVSTHSRAKAAAKQ